MMLAVGLEGKFKTGRGTVEHNSSPFGSQGAEQESTGIGMRVKPGGEGKRKCYWGQDRASRYASGVYFLQPGLTV